MCTSVLVRVLFCGVASGRLTAHFKFNPSNDNTDLPVFASWRDGNRQKTAGISWQMSTDDPVPVPTNGWSGNSKTRLRVRCLCDGVYVVSCSLGDSEQNIYIFSAVSQTDYRAQSVVLGKPLLKWRFRNAVLVVSWGFVSVEAFLKTCKKCRKLKAPQLSTLDHGSEPFSYVWKITVQNFSFSYMQYMENNWELSLPPGQENLLAASQRVISLRTE